MRRCQLLVLAALSLLLILALPAAAGAITRDQVLTRAKAWVDAGVAYSQVTYTGGYRQDCSGFVSMAWSTGDDLHHLDAAAGRPPDYESRRCCLETSFWTTRARTSMSCCSRGWANAAHTSYDAYEMTPPKAYAPTMDYPYWSWFAYSGYYRPFRYNAIKDGAPAEGSFVQVSGSARDLSNCRWRASVRQHLERVRWGEALCGDQPAAVQRAAAVSCGWDFHLEHLRWSLL